MLGHQLPGVTKVWVPPPHLRPAPLAPEAPGPGGLGGGTPTGKPNSPVWFLPNPFHSLCISIQIPSQIGSYVQTRTMRLDETIMFRTPGAQLWA